MKNKFKKGLILGGLLAGGAAVGFAMSKSGQQLSKDLKKDLKALAKNLSMSLHQMQDVTKEGFDELADTLVEEYARQKKLAGNTKKSLKRALQAKWHEMEAEYLAEKNEMKTKK